MRIAYYLPPEESTLSGCDLWRVAMPMRTIAKHGDLEKVEEINRFQFKIEDGRVVGTNIDPDEFDIMHVGRPVIREFINFAHVVKDTGIKFTMDFDDDFTDVHEENESRKNFSEDILESFEEIVGIADGITVTTQFLADKFGHLNDNFAVIDNYVPESLILDKVSPRQPIVGWAGGVSVHPRDLEVVGTAVRDFLWKNRDWKFHHVGDGKVNKILKAPTIEFGTVPVLEYMGQIKRFKIGIAPLEESDFNKAKSRLKILEMSALGVPWIASPLPEYLKAHEEHGVGIIAETPEEWLDALNRYRSSELFRMSQIRKGLEYARKNTYRANYHRWIEFFQNTLDN